MSANTKIRLMVWGSIILYGLAIIGFGNYYVTGNVFDGGQTVAGYIFEHMTK